ncbi:HU family DNA-binding protein [Bradyrhizobium sp. USDA 3262]
MATQLSKSQVIEKIATTTELSKRDVKNVLDSLVDVGHKELKKAGVFLVPGFAKFVVVKKPATKARKGTTTELSKRDVKNVLDSLVDVGHKELKNEVRCSRSRRPRRARPTPSPAKR